MTELPPEDAPGSPADPERTREIRLPPVPGWRNRVAPEPAVADGGPADQPTDQLSPPEPRQPTGRFGPWQPLYPRVVPRRRSRTPYVVTALALLIVAVGVVAVLVWG
jgi:hypothetical protein